MDISPAADDRLSEPPDPSDVNSLDGNIESGLRWSALREIVTNLVGTLGALAYTRMLQPEDLGAFGLAFLVLSALTLLIEAPIRDAVVYFRQDEEEYGSAAFWLLSGFAGAAVVLVLVCAGWLAQFYASPQAAGLTRLLSFAALLQALAVVPAAFLLKRFRFAVRESLLTIQNLILFAGWVTLAALGYGPWSLAIPVVVGTAFWTAGVWLAAGFRPALRVPRRFYLDILRYSRNLFGSKALTYIKTYIDNLAVGRLGERALGWYSLGEDQSVFAVLSVGKTIANVALPTLAAARQHMQEFRRIYLEMLRLAATLATPMQIGAFILADLGVLIFFGEQWMGAVPVLRAYLAYRLLEALLMICDSAASAVGRPDVPLRVDLLQIPFFVAAAWLGLQVWGSIAGVAWSLAIVRLAAGLVYFAVMIRVTGVGLLPILRGLLPSLLAGLCMGASTLFLRWRSGIDLPGQTLAARSSILAALVAAGAVLYFVLLFILDRQGFIAVMRLCWQVLLPPAMRTRLSAFKRRASAWVLHRKPHS